MKKSTRLLACMLVALIAINALALAADSNTSISLDALDSQTYSALQSSAVSLAQNADNITGMGLVGGENAQLCSSHYLPGVQGSALLAAVPSGSYVTVYEGQYSDTDSNTWMKAEYAGQTGYMLLSDLTLCSCENVDAALANHTDSCPDKSYVGYICANMSAQELYDLYQVLPAAHQEFILTKLSWTDQAKLAELQALIDGETLVETELTGSAGGSNITLNASLPEGVSLQFAEVNPAKAAAMGAMVDLSGFSENLYTYAFDIGLALNGAAYQPQGSVEISLSGIGSDDARAAEGYMVKVFHFLDTAAAVQAALANGTAIAYTADNLSGFDAELAASGVENTIYYTALDSESGSVTIDGSSISFETDSFSDYFIAAGNSEASKEVYYKNWYDNAFEILYGPNLSNYPTEKVNLYTMPGTTVTLYMAQDYQTSSVANWYEYDDRIGLNLGLPVYGSHTCKLVIPTNAPTSETNYLELRIVHEEENYWIRIYVIDKETLIRKAMNQGASTSSTVFDLYFACLKDPHNGLPGEPGVNTRSFYFDSSYSRNPYTYIDREKFTANSVQTYDGTNTLGVIDDDGLGTAVKEVLSSDINWEDQLLHFAAQDGVYGSDGVLLKNLTKAQVLENYVLVPYVVKMQTANGPSFNIDNYIRHKKSIELMYDANLPENLVLNVLKTPDTSFAKAIENPVISEAVKYASYGADDIKVALNTMIYLSDGDGNQYRYVFLGWDTKEDGTGTRYLPGENITVYENTILFGQWARVGDLKITKRVEKEFSGDTLPDDTFTFRITVPKGGTYPYTVYSSGNASISTGSITTSANTIGLKDGQYAVIKNLPVGNVTVQEINLDANYTTDWTTAHTPSIIADQQTDLICTNTYLRQKGTLKIVKTGANIDEDQVFVFAVTKSGSSEPIYVTITGTGEVTIQDVSAGSYTVEELESWSWRYACTDAEQTVNLQRAADGTMTAEVTFVNSRTTDQWLDDNTNLETNIHGAAG